MSKGMNSNLHAAKRNKKNEFYTQLSDIERELQHYESHFKGKVVYLNCDDPRESNFFHYFSFNFERLGLKKLMATCYKSVDPANPSRSDSDHGLYLEYFGDKDGNRVPNVNEIGVRQLEGDGDFRSPECVEFLKEADIVVTNPPFSLAREYIAQLMEYDKKFLVIGSTNWITAKEVFPFIKNNKMWLGCVSGAKTFILPDGEKQTLGNTYWYTNLNHSKRQEELILYRTYNPEDYPKYDNFDAINVSKVKDIPMDYDGVMGVPITFLDKHNPDQFEILGITTSTFKAASKTYPRQVQVNAKGERKVVTKLNDAPALKVSTPPSGKNYYIVDDNYFVLKYHRILVQQKIKGEKS